MILTNNLSFDQYTKQMAGIDLNKTKRQIETITLVSYNALIKWL